MAAVSMPRRITHSVDPGLKNRPKGKSERPARPVVKKKCKSRREVVMAIRNNEECLKLARTFAMMGKEERNVSVATFLKDINTILASGGLSYGIRRCEMLKAAKV